MQAQESIIADSFKSRALIILLSIVVVPVLAAAWVEPISKVPRLWYSLAALTKISLMYLAVFLLQTLVF